MLENTWNSCKNEYIDTCIWTRRTLVQGLNMDCTPTRFIVPRIYQVPFVQGCTSRYKDVWARAFVANENEFLPDLNN